MSQGGSAENPTETALSENSAAPGAARNPDLAAIAAAWPTLPAAVKAGILAMIQASAR